MRTIGLLALAAALWTAAPAAAFEPVGEAVPGSVHTGARHAAFETPAGDVTLIDGRTRAVSNVPRPRPDCRFMDVGGARLLWQCTRRPNVVVRKIATGRTWTLDIRPGEIGGSVNEVGRYWLKGHGNDHRGGFHHGWWNVADGTYGSGGGDARSIDDLDHRELVRPLCPPLRRPPNPTYDGEYDNDQFLPYAYDGRFGLYWSDGAWTLDRCAARSSLLPSRAVAAQLVAGRVTWVKGTKLVAHDARTKRSWSWRRTRIDPAATRAWILPTRDALVVVTGESDQDTRQRVYLAPFPG